MKGSDLLLISTYDSWTLLWNPDLIFLTSSNFEETNTAYCVFTMGNIGLTALITAQNTVLEAQVVFSLPHLPECKSQLSNYCSAMFGTM